MTLRIEGLNVDTGDPARLARWWAELLGWNIVEEGEAGGALEAPHERPEHGGAQLWFFRVLDAKTTKNRLHLDLRPDDQEAEVARAEAMGATRVDIGQGEYSWVVMADPEGNEFCILASEES